tara:strand:+ start:684 stop:878 length:195 start_codon:yes stop_codon:yes gene_type:complete
VVVALIKPVGQLELEVHVEQVVPVDQHLLNQVAEKLQLTILAEAEVLHSFKPTLVQVEQAVAVR